MASHIETCAPPADGLTLANTQKTVRLTDSEEAFCNNIVDGYERSEAYALAFPKRKTNRGEKKKQNASDASQLMRRPHIVARIAQLRTQAVQGFEVSREFLLENLLWGLNTSRERGSTEQVRKYVMDIGKLFGLIIEKSEADVLHRFQVMKDVTVNGEALSFDIGDGKVIDVKGEKIDAIDNPPDAVGALGVTLGGERDTTAASKRLQNAVQQADSSEVAPKMVNNKTGGTPARRSPQDVKRDKKESAKLSGEELL